MDFERNVGLLIGQMVKARQNIQAVVEEREYPHHHLSTLELVKVMRNNSRNAKFLPNNSIPRKEYNGVSQLYEGEGRGYYINSGKKAVGSVTGLADSKI